MPFPNGDLQLQTINGPDPLMTDEERKVWWRYKKIVRDFTWESEDGTTSITIKKNRFIDGASLPRFLWPFVGSPFSALAIPGSIHDELYLRGSNRGVADFTMGAIAREAKAVTKYQRRVVVLGLFLFGWLTWYKIRGTLPRFLHWLA